MIESIKLIQSLILIYIIPFFLKKYKLFYLINNV